ncbi:ion transporter [Nonomuraea wenchangensis]|uniref:ion transporter n=1 Tax=Nonomuraea wenchangensis TaxID=568860 RepID=UPI00343359A1
MHSAANRGVSPGTARRLLHAVDRIALVVFTTEIAARLYAYRMSFFKDPWNWFDTVIVAVALIPASGPTSVLRALRILRALRLVSAVPSMRRVVGALLTAMPGMASIIGLLVLLVYIAAVIATKLFGDIVPERFDELPRSLFTLFQIMTGYDWGNVAQDVMEHKPWAWLFFIRYLRGDPRLQAGEESDSCRAGQEQAKRRQADRRRLSDSAGARVISHI